MHAKIYGFQHYISKIDSICIELPEQKTEDALLITGIDAHILSYNLHEKMYKDYIYLLSNIEDSTGNYVMSMTLVPKYEIERDDISGFFTVKDQVVFIHGKYIPSLFFKTDHRKSFYSRREWVEVNSKMLRWDTFGIKEFFPSWLFSYKNGKLLIIEEHFNPLNLSNGN